MTLKKVFAFVEAVARGERTNKLGFGIKRNAGDVTEGAALLLLLNLLLLLLLLQLGRLVV